MSQKPNLDAKNIGARFRSARSLVPNLNRKSFCERYQINRYTVQSWENGLHVSKGKNVEKFIEALAREEVYCTAEWLIDGTGEPARVIKTGAEPNGGGDMPGLPVRSRRGHENFAPMIEQLQKMHQDLGEDIVSLLVNNDDMAPKFAEGDLLLGISIDANILSLEPKYCIVQLAPDRLIVRQVIATKDHLILSAYNYHLPAMMLNLETRIYKIIWHLLG